MERKFDIEIFELEEPITVVCVTAESFPRDIMKAHKTLHEIAPFDPKRKYFGISWGGKEITYKAAATELHPGELQGHDLEEFVIRKGKYLSVLLEDFNEIKDAIQVLISDQRVDPNGYCVEMYLENDVVRCMVTMKEWRPFL